MGAFSTAMRRSVRIIPGPIRAPIRVLVHAIRMYGRDDCSVYAASVSYFALFSLVPLTILTVSLFGYFVDIDQLVDFAFNQFPIRENAETRESFRNVMEQSRNLRGWGLAIGLPLLLWTASGLTGAVRRGLNATRHERINPPLWRAKLIDFAMVMALGLLVLVSISLTAVAQILIQRGDQLDLPFIDKGTATWTVSVVLPSLVSFPVFLFLYRFVPTQRPTWLHALVSAIVATLLFETVKQGGAFIIGMTEYGKSTGIYAGVGAVFIFLFWTYINASIMLFSAEIGQAIFEPTPEAAERRREARAQASSWHSSLPALGRSKGLHDARRAARGVRRRISSFSPRPEPRPRKQ